VRSGSKHAPSSQAHARPGRSGTVTVIQRFGSALDLSAHFHTLALDGVFAERKDETLAFAPLPPPSTTEVESLLATVRTRLLRLPVFFSESTRGLAHLGQAHPRICIAKDDRAK
jgi:hypothetical protein